MLNYLVEKKKVFKRDLNVESVDFNRKFAFSYNGKKVEKQADIFKVISPSMQIKLLDLYQKKGPFKVLFAEDYVVFLFLGDFLKKPRMEYARKFEISESDIEKIESDFNGLIELAVPIAQRLH